MEGGKMQHVFFMLILTTWAFNDILWRLVFRVYVKRKTMMLMLLVRELLVVLNTRKLGQYESFVKITEC